VATLGGIIALLVIVGLAFLAGHVAQRKGRPFWLYLLAGLIVGPLALIAALVLPKRRLA
jgi:predicted Kef-type K+ transport protein